MPTSNLAQFNREVTQFAKSIPGKVVEMQKMIVLQALRRLVKKTPVRWGRARGNWQVTIGSPADGQLDRKDPEGDSTIAAGLAAITVLPPFQVVWITNNVDYIEFLESGSSEQAGEGMLAITIEELRNMFTVVK